MLHCCSLLDIHSRSERDCQSDQQPSFGKHWQQSRCDPQHSECLEKGGTHHDSRGTGGAELCKDPSRITLYQIYAALEPNGVTPLIGIHPCEGRRCPVAQNIHKVLETPYHRIEDAVKKAMEAITLQSMIQEFHRLMTEEKASKPVSR